MRPLGPGSNNLHMAGKVDVQDDMPVGSGWSRFRYQYTSLAKEVSNADLCGGIILMVLLLVVLSLAVVVIESPSLCTTRIVLSSAKSIPDSCRAHNLFTTTEMNFNMY